MRSSSALPSISHTTFSRYKPFWIVPPNENNRDTYACIKHENMRFIVESLFFKKIISLKCSDDNVKMLVYSTNSKDCVYGICLICKNRKYLDKFCYLKDNVTDYKWKTVSEERIIKNQTKVIKKTAKAEHATTVQNLFSLLNKEINSYRKHIFNMRHQMTQLHDIKQL